MVENSRVLVIIPAYNEEKSIGRVIKEIKENAPGSDVVVIDDGSIDTTSRIARQNGTVVLSHSINLGYGAALQTGYKYTLGKNYDCVVQLDADGQHSPRYINDLLNVLKNESIDIVIGSRFLGDREYKIPWIRRLGMRFLAFVTSFVIGQKITDSSSGFRALKRKAADFFAYIDYPSDYDDADVIILAHSAGFRIKEVPVTMYESISGKSMFDGGNLIYYGFKMVLSIMVTLLREKPQRRE